MGYNPFCTSSYLTFRYVTKEGLEWKDGVIPDFPKITQQSQVGVKESGQILEALRNIMGESNGSGRIGILLSAGIDSAILAALMPAGSSAYTVTFNAPKAVDESEMAMVYAEHCGLIHRTVEVGWEDYLQHMDYLMMNKKAPLHPVEAGLFMAASAAYADGVNTLVIGNGADSTFGGMNKLLSRDWTFDAFVKRYTFVDPALVLNEPVSMRPIYEPYKTGEGIDSINFLKVTHGLGIVQAFDNAIGSAGCMTLEPYEQLFLDVPLDLKRIRSGEPKYLLRTIFEQLYPGVRIPEKIPFARPMDRWMEDWSGPERPEFRKDIDLSRLTGEQKWLIYCLEKFMNLMESENDT